MTYLLIAIGFASCLFTSPILWHFTAAKSNPPTWVNYYMIRMFLWGALSLSLLLTVFLMVKE